MLFSTPLPKALGESLIELKAGICGVLAGATSLLLNVSKEHGLTWLLFVVIGGLFFMGTYQQGEPIFPRDLTWASKIDWDAALLRFILFAVCFSSVHLLDYVAP